MQKEKRRKEDGHDGADRVQFASLRGRSCNVRRPHEHAETLIPLELFERACVVTVSGNGVSALLTRPVISLH